MFEFYGDNLWLIRYEALGYSMRMEQITRPTHEVTVEKYASTLFAYNLVMGNYKFYNFQLVELDELVNLCAYILPPAADDFSQFCEDVQGFYNVRPCMSPIASFGYYSDSAAWLYPHRDAPAMFFKRDNKDRVVEWANQIAEALPKHFNPEDLEWPATVPRDERGQIEMTIPEELRGGERRRIRGRAVMRAII